MVMDRTMNGDVLLDFLRTHQLFFPSNPLRAPRKDNLLAESLLTCLQRQADSDHKPSLDVQRFDGSLVRQNDFLGNSQPQP